MTNAVPKKASFEEPADDVLDSLPCGVISTLPDGTIVYVNETFVAWTGQSREALLAGQRFQDLLTVPGRIFYETHFAPLLRMQGFVKEIACQLKRAGQDPLHILVNSNLKLGSKGEPIAIRTAIFDATDRVKYEQELRGSRTASQQLAAIVTSSSDAIVSVGLDAVVRSWNPAATALFGYAETEAVGKSVDELIVPENLRAVRLQKYEKLRAGETVIFNDTVRHRKDGSLVPVEVIASPMRDDEGRVTAASLIFRDLSERKLTQMRLQDSEARLRLGIHVAGIGLAAIDYRSETVVLDEIAAKLFALPINRPLPRGEVHARFHPDDAPTILAKIADALNPAGDGVLACEHRILRPDGSFAWISARKQVDFSTAPDGSKRAATGLLAVLDITERRLAEAAVAEREERLRLILDSTLAFIGVMESDGTLIEANAPALAAGGVTRQDVLNRKLWDTHWFSYDQRVVQQIQDALARARSGDIVREDVVVRMRGDTRMTIDFMLSPIRDEEGRVRLLVPSGFDITERKRAETALRQSHDTYLNLIENNPFGVYLVDSDFRIAQISVGAQKVFSGITPVIGRDFEEVLRTLWQEPFASEAIARFRHTLETGEPYHSKDTTERRADLNIEESYDWQIERVTLPDGRFGVVCYFYDMTERKRYERHIQLLMGEVNHRAKNLLAVVQAIARQTARSSDPSTFAIHLSERIQGLAASQDLLVKNQWTNVAVSDLVHAQLAHFNNMIGTRVLIEGPPAHLSPGAAQGIGMALHELATNAVKYGALSNPSGRIRINWETIAAPEPTFTVRWVEEGGPEVVPPSRKGFGNKVIERMVEDSVDGKVEIEYRKSGLYWKLSVPTANLTEIRELG